MSYRVTRDYNNKYQEGHEVVVLLDTDDDLLDFMDNFGPVAPGSHAKVMAYNGAEYFVNASGDWYINASEGDTPIYVTQLFNAKEVGSDFTSKAIAKGDSDLVIEYSGKPGYQIDTVTVWIAGAKATAGTDYTLVANKLTVTAAKQTGNVKVQVESSAMCVLTQSDGYENDSYTTTQEDGLVANGADLQITYTAEDGYALEGVDVWINNILCEDGEEYDWTELTGTLDIDGEALTPGAIIDINVGTVAQVAVTQTDGDNDDTFTSTLSDDYVTPGEDLEVTYAAAEGYQIDGITVEFDGVAQTAGEAYEFAEGVLTIDGDFLTPGLELDITLKTSAVAAE